MTISDSQKYILVTGGIGFIGSHVVVKLVDLDYHVLIYDNLTNSDVSMVNKINQITNRPDHVIFVKGDIRDKQDLEKLFQSHDIVHVLHFAALKSVSESEKYPDLYNDVNVIGTQNLFNLMYSFNFRNFIYSSSATVYGDSPAPTTEDSSIGNNLACNYARNKYDMEQYLLKEHGTGLFKDWNIIILRYFNPIGAHSSGIIGEDPNGIPNNVFPYLLRVAKWTNDLSLNKDMNNPYKIFTVFGNNYNTRDGTCVRDYIHVQDLARAHVDVLSHLKDSKLITYNVGTGIGSTVFELVNSLNNALKKKNKKQIKFTVGDKRTGDLDISYAKVDKIYEEIGFKTELNIDNMCNDGLNFVGL